MNKFYTCLILYILFIPYSMYGQGFPKDSPVPNDKTITLDVNGNEIENKELFELLSSGKYTADPIIENGVVKYMQVRRTSPDEENVLSSIMKQSNDKSMIGTLAPRIQATDLALEKFDSDKLRGKVIVLNFWFADCPPCIKEIPELNELYKTFQDNDQVEFLSVTFDDSKKAEETTEKYKLLYPVVSEGRDICNDYSIVGYPTNIVIDQKGEYYFFESGGRDGIGEEIMRAINMSLKGMRSLQLPADRKGFKLDESKRFKLMDGETIPYKIAKDLIANGYHVSPQIDINGDQYYVLKKGEGE